MSRTRVGQLFWLLAYVATMALIVYTLLYVRSTQVQRLNSAQAKRDWQQWREGAKKDSAGDGPVRRRVPKSVDPPLLVLLTEHFAVLLVSSLVFGSVLFFVVLFLLHGAIAQGKFEVQPPHDGC